MAITNGYCTLVELKSHLEIDDNLDDTRLELAINTASREIDQFTGRTFYTEGTATRVFQPDDNFLTGIDDLISVTTIKTSTVADGTFDQTWAATDYQLEPLNGRAAGLTGWPFTRIRAVGEVFFPKFYGRATLQIVGVWGWSAVPDAIKTATLLQAARVFKRADAPFGAAGFGDVGIIRVTRAIDPDVEQAIAPYRLMRAVG